MNREILRIDGVTLERDDITYLNNFSLWMKKGEILGLISTDQQGLEQLIDLIVENTPVKYGKVYFNEELVNDYIQSNPAGNNAYVINQKLRLIPDLTVTDNMFVLRKGFKKLVINSSTLEASVQEVLDQLNIKVQADAMGKDLLPFEKCVVELIKAVLSGVKLIIAQGISEMVSFSELKVFYELMRHYQQQGISFLYIGHHHEDVFEIAERVVLYDNGEIIKVLYPDQMNTDNINPYVKIIKGQKREADEQTSPVLVLKELAAKNSGRLDFSIYSGKCTTILDQDHSLPNNVIDITDKKVETFEGTIIFEGKQIIRNKELKALQNQTLVIPEDPVNHFLFLNQSVMYNLAFLVDRKIRKSIISGRIIDSIKKEWDEIFCPYVAETELTDIPLNVLYSLAYYKVMLYHPKIVYLVQPFSGVDMYLRVHIAELIMKLKEEHIAVILLTNFVADSLAVTDQFILLEDGKQITDSDMFECSIIQRNYYKDIFLNQ